MSSPSSTLRLVAAAPIALGGALWSGVQCYAFLLPRTAGAADPAAVDTEMAAAEVTFEGRNLHATPAPGPPGAAVGPAAAAPEPSSRGRRSPRSPGTPPPSASAGAGRAPRGSATARRGTAGVSTGRPKTAARTAPRRASTSGPG